MKFKVRQEELVEALNVIKNSKSFGKSSKGEVQSLFIKVENDKITFAAMNLLVWVKSFIFESDYDDVSNKDECFSVESNGSIFVNGEEFVNLTNTYQKGSILDIELNKDENGNKYLTVICSNLKKKGRKKTSKFLSVDPEYFEENPPEEERESVFVSTGFLKKAVESVEFASSSNDDTQHLGGVQVEIYGDSDISAFATDRTKICWYDSKGYDRKEEYINVFNPVKASFVSALKTLKDSEETVINIGKRYTILEQKHAIHGVPNVVIDDDEKESMPDWRKIASSQNDSFKTIVKLPLDFILNCIKTANSTSCSKYGLRIHFDSKEQSVVVSFNTIEDGSVQGVLYEEVEPLPDGSFEGEEIDGDIVIILDNIKDIMTKYSGENVIFKITDCFGTPIQIESAGESFKLITGVNECHED